MKPELSIIPEADHSTEDRAVSQAMKQRVREEQGGICARSWCEAPALDVDHVIALWNGGTNARSNLEALCTVCHAQKTRAEAALRAKAKAQGGETGQWARRQKRGHGSITQRANPWPATGTVKFPKRPFPKARSTASNTGGRHEV